MSRPLAICLEDLTPRSPDERYLRCVAVVGRAPGLRVDDAGSVLWRDEAGAACELWVSADERLVLYRPDSGGRVVVRRAARSLEVPAAKPVILLDQDEVEVGGRRLRVHVHGDAPWVHAPQYLRTTAPRGPAKVAAALALGAALGAAGCKKDEPVRSGPPELEVREQPPAEAPPPEGYPSPAADAAAAPGTADAGGAGEPDAVPLPDTSPDIEVRVAPPQVPAPMADVVEPPVPVASDAGGARTEVGPAADAAAEPPDDAGRRRRDARTPPPIEVRDLPPFVEKK
ncbi:MAG: hypothetical protein JXB32_14510 [Deltaproteobacteria bacterium]|nr:hypothetical protein [Deltaproteobacteria bacterium]